MSFINSYISSFKGLSQESWMLSIVMFLNRAGAMVLPFLGIYINTSLGYSISDAGMVLSCFGLGSIIGSTLGGWLTDKIGNYSVQVGSLFLTAPIFMVLPHFKTLYALCAGMFVLSIISQCFLPANSVAISKYAKPENLTRAFSLNRLAINLGFSVGPAIGGFLSAISFDLLFYINGIACLIAGITYILFFRSRKERNTGFKSGAVPNKHIQSPYKDIPFISFTIICAIFCICFFQLLSTLPLYLSDDRGLDQSQIGLLMGFSGILIVLIEMPLVKFVERRLTIAQIMLYGTLITSVSYLLYLVNPTIALLYAAIFLMSIGEMLILPFMSTVTALRSNEHNKGVYMGMNSLSASIAFVISPVLGTKIVEMFSYDTLWFGTFVLLVFSSIGFYLTTKRLLTDSDATKVNNH